MDYILVPNIGLIISLQYSRKWALSQYYTNPACQSYSTHIYPGCYVDSIIRVQRQGYNVKTAFGTLGDDKFETICRNKCPLS